MRSFFQEGLSHVLGVGKMTTKSCHSPAHADWRRSGFFFGKGPQGWVAKMSLSRRFVYGSRQGERGRTLAALPRSRVRGHALQSSS